MDRLDLQHQLWLYTLHNELFIAPIQNPQNVLDFGTGTGIWAIEVGMLDSRNSNFLSKQTSAHLLF